ncbi:KpsF/GutQ family sugar-phosphate isomerase [Pseudochelatococcus contaminans]|uniref:Arabinose-5-phosphate isomerase n=1 Tax=Pseudochelatococcus contaminans TaxID=1538103 RepID=A0A7W6EIF3_9HYPH|nr:KpsF/GutQ family sugar-phosphate isomerase [Pseudochelatococcus contaminans]MBB3811023.1 arabinose-5-phosphate isomerase [Pseudochelatococcus contaminans]
MPEARQAPVDPLVSAIATIDTQRRGLELLNEALSNGLAAPFRDAIARIRNASGRVIVTGMGKSGHVGRKIAATLSSTGTPAYFVHPSEASHGDLGQIQTDDIILALSWSGATAELSAILTYAKRFDIPVVAITSDIESELGRAADVGLILPKAQEACPNGLAPTTSTTMQLVIGDAIAIALIEARGFSAQDFKIFHPGGKLGAQLRFVREMMHAGERLPLVKATASMADALVEMSAKGLGCVVVIHDDGKLAGIVTDGDLRRHMTNDLPAHPVSGVMTRAPKVIAPGTLAGEALQIIERTKVSALVVTDEDDRPVGVLHILDLVRAGTV